jgi:hypothetical protein
MASLCNDDTIDCVDCCGYGVCSLTKGMENPDDRLTKVFKEIFGLDTKSIKDSFDK